MKKLTKFEATLLILLIANLLFSFWLYSKLTSQDQRLRTLERDDAIQNQIQSLNSKYDSLKQHLQGLLH